MPAYTRDPRTLRGVRIDTLAVRPDYTTSSAHREAVPTGSWVILSLQGLTKYARIWGQFRLTGQAYAGMFAYAFPDRESALRMAQHIIGAAASREAQRQENRRRHLEFQASLPKTPRGPTASGEARKLLAASGRVNL